MACPGVARFNCLFVWHPGILELACSCSNDSNDSAALALALSECRLFVHVAVLCSLPVQIVGPLCSAPTCFGARVCVLWLLSILSSFDVRSGLALSCPICVLFLAALSASLFGCASLCAFFAAAHSCRWCLFGVALLLVGMRVCAILAVARSSYLQCLLM